MTGKRSPSSKAGEKPSGDREARLSKALRDNLRKRKAQARERTGARTEPPKDKGKG